MSERNDAIIRATNELWDYVGPLLAAPIDETLVRAHIFSAVEKAVHASEVGSE